MFSIQSSSSHWVMDIAGVEILLLLEGSSAVSKADEMYKIQVDFHLKEHGNLSPEAVDSQLGVSGYYCPQQRKVSKNPN